MPDAPPLTDWVVLALVVEQPRHGFALARELAADGALGEVWTVPRPLVYRAIDNGHITPPIDGIKDALGNGADILHIHIFIDDDKGFRQHHQP